MKKIIQSSLEYLKKEKRLSVFYFITVIFSEIAFLSTPFVIAIIIDQIVAKQFNESIYRYSLLFIVLSLIDEWASRIGNTIKVSLVTKSKNIFTIAVLEKLQQKDYIILSKRWTGKLQKRIDNGIDAFTSLFNNVLTSVDAVILRWVIIVWILLWKAPLMIIGLILCIILIAGISYMIKTTTSILQKRINTITEQQAKQKTIIIMENLFFRLWNANSKEINKLNKKQKPLETLEPKSEFINELPFTSMAIGFRIRELAIYLYYGYQYIQWWMSIGIIMALVTYVRWLRRPIQNILNNMAVFRKNKNRLERLELLLDKVDTIIDGKKKLVFKNGDIVCQNLSFWYHEEKIFEQFSCEFPWWKTTAIVWHSWSGKSTLIKLLLRLYDPIEWWITIDQQQLTSLKKKSLYDAIWYISQESSIIDGTIKSNLLYGIQQQEIKKLSAKALDKLLWNALKKAHLEELIISKKDWILTKIGEKGLKLSWWEKQRLALARLFIKNPPIIILDEPTSALDSISEHYITESLKELTKGKTVIIIAHRLQTVMHADNIIVMKKWKVAEQGTHNDLIAQAGLYASLVDLQHWVIIE